jgi:predicted RND superfamily exporter protein
MTKDTKGLAHLVASLLTRRAITPILLLVAVLALCVATLPHLKVETGIDSMISPDAPERVFLRKVNEHFVGDEAVFVLYETDDVFSHRSLVATRRLGDDLEKLRLPGGKVAVEEVSSLTTIKVIEASDLAFKNVPLVPAKVPTEPAELARIRQRALDDMLVRENMFSDDGRVATLGVRLPPHLDQPETAAAVGAIRDLLAARQKVDPGTRYHVAGKPVIDTDEVAYAMRDLGRLMPIGYLVTALLLFLFTGRLLSMGITLVAACLSVVFSLAVLPLFGGSYNVCTSGLSPIITALAAAMAIHYFTELGKHGRRYPTDTPRQQARRTILFLLAPAGIAAFTTAVGFGVNVLSSVRSVRDFGVAAGFGVLGTFFVITVLFALIARWRPVNKVTSSRGAAMMGVTRRMLDGLASLLVRRHRLMLAGSAAVTLFMLVGIGRIVVGSDPLGHFDPDTPIRRATAVMERSIGGVTALVISIRHDREEHFTKPAALHKLAALDRFLRQKVGADRVANPVDSVKMMHRGFFNGDPKELRIPDTKEQVAQLLFLNGDSKLHEQIDEDFRWVRLVASLPTTDLATMKEKFAQVDRYLEERFPAAAGWHARTTGSNKLWVQVNSELETGLLRSFGLAFVVIFMLLFLLFRSLKTGLYAIPANVLPVLFNLGLMGWLEIPLDGGTVMVSSVAIGIAVDDTVHFLTHLRARLGLHGDLARGIRETLLFKGPAIIGTTVIITAGFSVVLLSSFAPARYFGLLICTGVVTALLADLFMLPAMLLAARSRLGLTKQEPAALHFGGPLVAEPTPADLNS